MRTDESSPGPPDPATGLWAIATALSLELAAIATQSSWPDGFELHLGCYVGAGLAWMVAVARLRRAPPGRRALRLALVAALAVHALAFAQPPRHSDDVHRYLWDGRVQRAGIDPYAHAPDAEALTHLRDENWSRMNNRHLPTIYPPFAQLGFRLAGLLPVDPLLGWRLEVVACELGIALLLGLAAGEVAALLWLLSPLVIFELVQDAHVEALGVVLLSAALVALRHRRRGVAGLLLGLSSATKLLPVYLLVALRDRRLRAAGLLAMTLAWLPFAASGRQVFGSLGEYGRRWRGNEGTFALLHAGASGLVWLAGKRQPTDETRLGPFGQLVTGRARNEAYPDELAAALARLAAVGLFIAAVAACDRRLRRSDASLDTHALVLSRVGIGAFLLLTPSLHPWYALWILPAVLLRPVGHQPVGHQPVRPERGRTHGAEDLAWLWLAATIPLGHAPLAAYLRGASWRDPVWTRLVEHVPALALCALSVWRSWRSSDANGVVVV